MKKRMTAQGSTAGNGNIKGNAYYGHSWQYSWTQGEMKDNTFYGHAPDALPNSQAPTTPQGPDTMDKQIKTGMNKGEKLMIWHGC